MCFSRFFLVILMLHNLTAFCQQHADTTTEVQWPVHTLGMKFNPIQFAGATAVAPGEQYFATRMSVQKVFYITDKLKKDLLGTSVEKVGLALKQDSTIHAITYFIPYSEASYQKVLASFGQYSMKSDDEPDNQWEIYAWAKPGYTLSVCRKEYYSNYVLVSYTLPYVAPVERLEEM